MNIAPITTKTYFTVTDRDRKGCPCFKTPFYQVSSLPHGARKPLIHNYTTMQLLHKSRSGEVKNSLPLDSIHKELEQAALLLDNSGASNILLSKLSFNCFITQSDGTKIRDYIHFDLKIPGTGTESEPVFSYDMIESMYGSKKKLYKALNHFYTLGKSIVNPESDTHGHTPEYNPKDSKHDQYIRHTEQLLIAYLALPEASEMIRNRLTTTIRGKYSGATSVRLYNTGLHMHSTKTCCAPCEYSLIGLMNDQSPSGFLDKFKNACSEPSDILRFTFPRLLPFKLLVTVTANQKDSDHRAEPTCKEKSIRPHRKPTPYHIDVKSPDVLTTIFTTLLANHYSRRNLPTRAVLSDKTVGISGSKATPGSSKAMKKAKKKKSDELDKFTHDISLLRI
jgi:hypothetical protein